MFTNRSVKVATLIVAVMVLSLLSYAFVQKSGVPATMAASGRTLDIEIAENGTRFIPDETPVFDDGLPAAGAEFITEGYIYPAGTLTCEDNECNGVLENGDPEFPDLVMGTWICRGWHINDGGHTERGPWVVTTQIYDFGETAGNKTIVTDGFEGPEYDTVITRAIVGGTGQYSNVRGVQTQELLGWNGSIGVGLSVSFDLIGAGGN